MRVLTAPLPMAPQPAPLYASCDADATACLVVHKALETAAEQGTAAARQMLFDCERRRGSVVGCLSSCARLPWAWLTQRVPCVWHT